jgi:DNA (cytosine-5)-methyltransferase 1
MQQASMFDLLGSEYDDYKQKQSNDWKWYLKDYPQKENIKVFSCFACGGGSTMGYKLAGCDVVGCLEIDKRMLDVYTANHNPKYSYCMDIRDFNKIPNDKLPEELFNLDILDGSPPCTTFSMAGKREKTWGKVKKFREGQKEQTLDDLSFIFIETVAKLQPKFVVMENVEGLMNGNAWRYVQNIYKHFNQIGYKVHHWLMKGERLGIPQRRHRVFFIATRLDIDVSKIDLYFNYEPVNFGQIKSEQGGNELTDNMLELLKYARYGDRNLENACWIARNKSSFFNYCFVYDDQVAPTLTAHCNNIRWDTKTYLSKQDVISMATFPQDYNFLSGSIDSVSYICGMSVPPVMIKRIVERLKPYITGEKYERIK